jgi:hypothetical protein
MCVLTYLNLNKTACSQARNYVGVEGKGSYVEREEQ